MAKPANGSEAAQRIFRQVESNIRTRNTGADLPGQVKAAIDREAEAIKRLKDPEILACCSFNVLPSVYIANKR